MQVSKWGDSLAVRLPKALVDKMGLTAGDELNIVDVIERTLVVEKEDRRKAALERLASLNWTFRPITSSIGTRPTSGEGVLHTNILVYAATSDPKGRRLSIACAAAASPAFRC